MYAIKQSPEDFIVKELSNIKLKESGGYSICLLKKTNYTTLRAVEQIAKSLKKPLKDFGFAGTKDKKAVTEQFISIKNVKKEKIEKISLKDIQLKFIGYNNEPISLGDLEGNGFIITIRNLNESEIKKIENKTKAEQIMPNYFGEQRFSKNNIEIGRNIIKGRYKEAVDLILSTNSDNIDKIESLRSDYIGALRTTPKKLLKLYIHAYQSYLWNKTLTAYLKTIGENIHTHTPTYIYNQIPISISISIPIQIIGFGTELENNVIGDIISKIMENEKINFRDFIIKKIPELSSEGSSREAFIEIKDLKLIEKNKESVKINFKLKRGSYATVAIAFLLDNLDSVLKDFL